MDLLKAWVVNCFFKVRKVDAKLTSTHHARLVDRLKFSSELYVQMGVGAGGHVCQCDAKPPHHG